MEGRGCLVRGTVTRRGVVVAYVRCHRQRSMNRLSVAVEFPCTQGGRGQAVGLGIELAADIDMENQRERANLRQIQFRA